MTRLESQTGIGRPRRIDGAQLIALLTAQPSATLEEIAAQLGVSKPGALRALHRHGKYTEWRRARERRIYELDQWLSERPGASIEEIATQFGLTRAAAYNRVNRCGYRRAIQLESDPTTERQREASEWLAGHIGATITELAAGLGITRTSAAVLLRRIGYRFIWAKLE